jgi:hypothetical protein
MRALTDKARDFGAGPLFDQLLPLLMAPTLEDSERHVLVKVVDRILGRLEELVRPYVNKILVVIEPLLIDEDYYARVEGRDIIANLAKAAGLATMIAAMRPDVDHVDEYVRNTTARAFAVVASALGIPALLPFLKAVCRSKKSWQARHTGCKVVQQIAVLAGCGVLPHLAPLVATVGPGLTDDQGKVKTQAALAIAALAEAAAPYGLYYAPDPSSQIACTIGGNVAENAGGVHCLKYGLTVHNVWRVRAVLITGDIVEFGGDAPCQIAIWCNQCGAFARNLHRLTQQKRNGCGFLLRIGGLQPADASKCGLPTRRIAFVRLGPRRRQTTSSGPEAAGIGRRRVHPTFLPCTEHDDRYTRTTTVGDGWRSNGSRWSPRCWASARAWCGASAPSRAGWPRAPMRSSTWCGDPSASSPWSR